MILSKIYRPKTIEAGYKVDIVTGELNSLKTSIITIHLPSEFSSRVVSGFVPVPPLYQFCRVPVSGSLRGNVVLQKNIAVKVTYYSHYQEYKNMYLLNRFPTA